MCFRLVRSSNPPSANSNSHGSVAHCPKNLSHVQHPEANVGENLNSPETKTCSIRANLPQKRSFVPVQGMDSGQYPRALFYQYYPNQDKTCTFDLLPLPFMEARKYQEMCVLSMDDEHVQEKWKDFLYNLLNGEFQSTTYPDDRFWRWKNYLRYTPNENKNEFRYRMQAGPKYDSVGRFPITGEDLKIFRKMKMCKKTDLNYTTKKGNGTRKQ